MEAEDDFEGVRLRSMLKALGGRIKFKIIQQLDKSPAYPKELAAEFNLSRSDVSQHLKELRKLGFVEWDHPLDDDDRFRLYQIQQPLPSLKHQVLIELLSTAEEEELEQREESKVEERAALQKQIEAKKREKLRTTLKAIAAHTQLPAGMFGRAQQELRNELRELKDEIARLSAKEFEIYDST